MTGRNKGVPKGTKFDVYVDANGNVQVATAWNPSLSTTGKALIMGF